MPVTDQIAEVLRKHYPVFDENGHINGTVPGKGAWDCWCGEVVDTAFDAVTAHIAEKIAELFTEEERSYYDHAEPYGTAYEHRWVSAWFPDA